MGWLSSCFWIELETYNRVGSENLEPVDVTLCGMYAELWSDIKPSFTALICLVQMGVAVQKAEDYVPGRIAEAKKHRST